MAKPLHQFVPESPIVDLGYDSPDDRSTEASSSRLARKPSVYPTQPSPRFLAIPSSATLLPLLQAEDRATLSPAGKGNDLRTALVLRHALQFAVEHGDIELVTWLAGLKGKWAEVLDAEVQDFEDDDGWGLVGMAVQCSCGRQDKEECVRVVVSRWGLETGPRGGKDRTGWTPLHLAALLSTPPLVSFLLTRGASPHALTDRGLTPADLITDMQNREEMAVLLSHATSSMEIKSISALIPSTEKQSRANRQAMLQRRRDYATRRLEKSEQKEKRNRQKQERELWVREKAKTIDVDPDLLLAPRERPRSSQSVDSGLGWINENGRVTDEADESADENDACGVIQDDDKDESLLVFSLGQVPLILDIMVTTYRPSCQPSRKRAVPANALFLYARFAYHRCDESWLEELVERAVEKIEQGVYGNVEDLAYLAFWAYNTTLLLHLFRTDKDLCAACEELGLLSMIEELINAIHVFVIRVAERRIDSVLDLALLDYETLEDFDDIRFEGEWTLFRSFATKKKRETILPNGSAGSTNGSPARHSVELGSSPSAAAIFNSLRENVSHGSPFKSLSKPQSMQNLRSIPMAKTDSPDGSGVLFPGAEIHSADEVVSPKRVTDILSSVLLVLQLYEVNPAIVVQAFSQVFFWIACELFNRILTRKKYLCRIKAVQIRMNITVLEDWVRINGLPVKTATKHLEPVTQLLQWLQCASQVTDFDRLIGTMQNLKALNPMQMRRAVRDYRFEVSEGRMTDECAQYLAQLQKDWERRRIQMGVEAMQAEAARRASDPESSANSMTTGTTADQSTPIDALFDGSVALSDFVPQSAPECLGELLDSRFMLPFLLPEKNEYLVATPPKDAAFLHAFPFSPLALDGSRSSRPPSRASFSSSRPMDWTLPNTRQVRELPLDFFTWLKDQEAERRQGKNETAKSKIVLSPLLPVYQGALGPSQRDNLPTKPLVDMPLRNQKQSEMLSAVSEDEPTPTVASSKSMPTSRSSGAVSRPPAAASPLRSSMNSSPSLEQRNAQPSSPQFVGSPQQSPFKMLGGHERSSSVTSSYAGGHIRAESFELKIRNAVNSLYSPPSSAHVSLPGRSNQNLHYELARHRRERVYSDASSGRMNSGGISGEPASPGITSPRSQGSMSSDGTGSGGSDGGKRKWWKVGRKTSSGHLRDDRDRSFREGSDDTIVGVGLRG